MNAINVKPLSDRVVIKPAAVEEKTSGGIIIPDNIKEKPLEGTIVAVGPGKKDEQMTLKIGDRVLYSKYGGTEFKYADETYLIMRESDVYAVL